MAKGRGAWPKTGTGGTLAPSAIIKGKTIPGPYYMLAGTGETKVGASKTNLNELAVNHGVIALQVLAQRYFANVTDGRTVPITGVFDAKTKAAMKDVQKRAGLVSDGQVGLKTAKVLIMPLIKDTGKDLWPLVYGIVKNEGGFDPGAVGRMDNNDLGLAQINILSHPDVSFSNAFCPSFAMKWLTTYFTDAIAKFKNIDDAIASYNLGAGGTRQWIKAGRPDIWVREGVPDRPVRAYIERIKGAAAKDGLI